MRRVCEVVFLMQGPVEHCTIGVQLLSVLTSEMNQVSEADANRSLTKHRRIASSFRDQQLFEIFRLCCTLLKSALDSRKTLGFDGDLQVCENKAKRGTIQKNKMFKNTMVYYITASFDEPTSAIGT